jgi:hypothetical protein
MQSDIRGFISRRTESPNERCDRNGAIRAHAFLRIIVHISKAFGVVVNFSAFASPFSM